jgi:hypothetical protein
MDHLLTPTGLAREAGVTRERVYELARLAVISPVATTERGVKLFEPAAVEIVARWLAANRRERRQSGALETGA